MKKRLVSVLLALTLCGALAVPAFAEQAEEVPAPGESEVFSTEETLDFPDLTEAEVGEVRYGHIHWLEDCNDEEPLVDGTEETEEGTVTYRYGYMCFDDSCPDLIPMSITTQNETTTGPVIIPYDCGNHKWGNGDCKPITRREDIGNPYYHLGYYERWQICINDARCTVVRIEEESKEESHRWLRNDYTGNNYHKGKLHYLEWTWSCTLCGYTETRWESRTCPGNNDGTGCVFPINGVNPPVEMQDLTEPEEIT